MSVIKTKRDVYADQIIANAYGLDSAYDAKAGGVAARKGVGKIEDGPTIPRAKNPTVGKVTAANPQADIPTAQFASTIKAAPSNPYTGNMVTDGQAKQMQLAKSKVSAYIAKAGGQI